MRTVAGRALLGFLAIALVLAGLAAGGVLEVPARYDPFAPLDIDEEPNLWTGWKLARLERDGPLCRAVLSRARGLAVTPVPDRKTGEGCGFRDAVRIDRSLVPLSPASPPATCAMAAAYALYERHGLEPAAREVLGQPVARIEHYGTYSCRNMYHRPSGRRSEHATANALDVAGFVLADGTRITLERDWRGSPDPRREAFLRRVRDEACRFFDVVLGPDYNEAHRDHFHLDRGGARACR